MIEEEHRRAVEKLKKLSAEGVPILAEGIRDLNRLRAIGVEGEIILIQGKSMPRLVHDLGGLKALIILTDFDRTGAQKCSRLKTLLEGYGVKVNTDLRLKIFSTTFSKRVEELHLPE
ncbi:MAG: hypothetical protein ABH829_01610 [archaeon]